MTDDLRIVIGAAKETLERYNMRTELNDVELKEIRILTAALFQVQLLLQQLKN